MAARNRHDIEVQSRRQRHLAGPPLGEPDAGGGLVQQSVPDEVTRSFLNPGVRWAFDFDSGLQIVPGVAYTIGLGPSPEMTPVPLPQLRARLQALTSPVVPYLPGCGYAPSDFVVTVA